MPAFRNPLACASAQRLASRLQSRCNQHQQPKEGLWARTLPSPPLSACFPLSWALCPPCQRQPAPAGRLGGPCLWQLCSWGWCCCTAAAPSAPRAWPSPSKGRHHCLKRHRQRRQRHPPRLRRPRRRPPLSWLCFPLLQRPPQNSCPLLLQRPPRACTCAALSCSCTLPRTCPFTALTCSAACPRGRSRTVPRPSHSFRGGQQAVHAVAANQRVRRCDQDPAPRLRGRLLHRLQAGRGLLRVCLLRPAGRLP